MTDQKTKREELLHDAATVVAGERDVEYGGPEDSFTAIADHWNAYLKNTRLPHTVNVTLDATDVSLMMALLKVARLETGGTKKRDTWMDLAGYAACGWEVTDRG